MTDTNYVQIILNIIRKCLYFVDLTTFCILGQKFVKFFVGFLEYLRLSKRHSEINWPLGSSKLIHLSFSLLLLPHTFFQSWWQSFETIFVLSESYKKPQLREWKLFSSVDPTCKYIVYQPTQCVYLINYISHFFEK